MIDDITKKLNPGILKNITVIAFVALTIYLNWDPISIFVLSLVVYLFLSAKSSTYYGWAAAISLVFVIVTTAINRAGYTEIFVGIAVCALIFAIVENFLKVSGDIELL